MNCQSCNTRIDYHFLTNCTQCGCAVDPTNGSELPQFQPLEPVENRLTWIGLLFNLAYVLVSSVAGLITGVVLFIVVGGLIFRAVLAVVDPNPSPGEYCGLGSALGFLSIVSGAFFGTVGGSVFAVTRPPCKTGVH